MRKNIFTISLLTILGLNACNSDNKNNNNKQENKTEKKEITTNNIESIVYVNSDSLITGYEFYKKSVKEIEVKKNQFAGDIENQATAFQNKVLKAQQNAQSMTMGEIEATKKNLAAEEQRLMQYRDALMQNLANQEKEIVDKMNKNIDDFIKRYAEKNGYKMVLGYKQGVTVWYADPKLDVTADVLKGLNEEYRNQGEAKNEKKDEKKDSTKK
jgi:outer membrane protein